VERGVGTGARIEAEAFTMTAGASHRAITERILRHADRAGQEVALIDAADGTVTAWPRFAQTVRAAALGLGRRGVAHGDTVGVLVQDAASYATAVHAIRAAGASALPIGAGRANGSGAGDNAGQDAEEIAARLSECRARVLLTAAPLAGLATRAADRSWVRQVFSFGEAEGTTPFCSLLEAGKPGDSLPDHDEPAGQPGPPGQLAPVGQLAAAGGLARGDVVVVAPPCGEGQAYTSLLDLALLAGATIVAAPVPRILAALRLYNGNAAIVPRGTHVPGLRADRVMGVALPLLRVLSTVPWRVPGTVLRTRRSALGPAWPGREPERASWRVSA
jgi:AMP-binding enzyme